MPCLVENCGAGGAVTSQDKQMDRQRVRQTHGHTQRLETTPELSTKSKEIQTRHINHHMNGKKTYKPSQ